MESKLAVIVEQSKLEPTKAKYILEKFQDYFEIASEWEVKAKAIVVTKANQEAEMEMARTGRLFHCYREGPEGIERRYTQGRQSH